MRRATRVWLCRFEMTSSIVGIGFFVLTLVDSQWIERWFDESPDANDGTLERWLVGGAFFVAALIAAMLAGRDRRKLAASPPLGD
jgi:hypothetical protein